MKTLDENFIQFLYLKSMHIKRLVKAKIPMNQAPFKNVPFYYYVLFPPSVK